MDLLTNHKLFFISISITTCRVGFATRLAATSSPLVIAADP